jgi:hypothetical protein
LSCCLCLWSWSSLQLILLPSKLDNWKPNSIRGPFFKFMFSYLLFNGTPQPHHQTTTLHKLHVIFEIASKNIHNQTLKKNFPFVLCTFMDNCTRLHVHFIPNHQTFGAHKGWQFFFIFVQNYTHDQTQKSPTYACDIGIF